MRDGAWLIAWGYFQKIFVADNLAGARQRASSIRRRRTTGVNVLLGVYAFAFQIYGDFAGYSNIARGTSKLMGIELIENFRFPYLVRTPQAFWRHWHISLSTWLRDYLYIPLGGSRGIGVADAAQPASSRWCSAGCGTARPGRSCSGASITACCSSRIAPPSGGARCRRLVAGAAPLARIVVVGGHVPPHLLRLADLPGAIGRPDRAI